MNDSIDQVIEEWARRPGCFVLDREDERAFVKYTAIAFEVVARWRRAGPEAVLLGYLQTGADAPREAGVEDLRVALGLPAWVTPPVPCSLEEVKSQRDAARLRVGELEREVGRMETEWSLERDAARKEIEWLKRAWQACRRVICEMANVQAEREELDEATRRFERARAAYREAEEGYNDGQP